MCRNSDITIPTLFHYVLQLPFLNYNDINFFPLVIIGFVLRGVYYANNDTIRLRDIGEKENALSCTTYQTNCCGLDINGRINRNERRGQFYYPNGTQVPIRNGVGSDGIFRGRGYQFIRLSWKGNTTAPPTGRYRCDIPDNYGVNTIMFINIGESRSSVNTFECYNNYYSIRGTSKLIIRKSINITEFC